MKRAPRLIEGGASRGGTTLGRLSVPVIGSLLGAALLAATAGVGFAAAQEPLVGTLHLVWDAEQTRDNPDGVLVYVVDDAGHATRLQLDTGSRLREYQSLDRRRVEVQADAILVGPIETGAVRLRSLRPLEAPAAPSRTPGADRLDFVTVLCRFADDPLPLLTPSRLARVLGPDDPGMQEYYAELSGDPGIMAGNSVTPVWYDLPEPRSYYVQGTQTAVDLLAWDCTQAAEADVDFSAYYGINLQFSGALSVRATSPYDVLSFGGSWTATLNGQTRAWGMTWISIGHAENYVVYAHEMGHALGWPHSSGRYGQEYDSNWDVMSRGYLRYEPPWGWLTVHTIGAYKDARGWIPAERRWEPAPGAVETGEMVRSALPPDHGYLLAVIGRGSDRFYTAEVRAPVGHDVGVPGKAIVLHEVDFGRAYVIDVDLNGDPNDEGAMWTSGETFTDSLVGLTLRVNSETADGFDVTITRGWQLDVTTTGEGQIEVRAATADGIHCPADGCSHVFPVRGTAVQLLAEPGDGWALRGWSGSCTGDKSCTVTMGSNQWVGAVFGRQLAVSAVLARLFDQPCLLTVDDLLFLDQLGNRNDRFDLGDVRAWLMHTGVLAASPARTEPPPTRDGAEAP